MKPNRVAVFAALGMLLTSVSVYSLTPPRAVASQGSAAVAAGDPEGTTAEQTLQTELGRFTAGRTLMIEGRVGHPRMVRSAKGETFVMLEVKGDSTTAKVAAPVNLAIVMDRSGSMKGTRFANAIQAATGAVDRLNEGDTVSVVSFDTKTSVVVPPTVISGGNRESINALVRQMRLGGDTCISCGVEEGIAQIEQTMGKVNKMMLLSDGDANHGVRDIPGFRSIAQRARDRGTSVTTIGVDVDYNEKIMSALAQESNGRHYFVENDATLARVFEAEAQQLTETVASGAEVSIDLAPGVELDRVFDRSFRRAGGRVIVPLGTFAAGEVKTVLLKVRVPAQGAGKAPVADVELGYRDLVANLDSKCNGSLDVEIMENAADASEIDGVVAGRVQRSETASTLKSANELFANGQFADARRKLEDQQRSLNAIAANAAKTAPSARAGDVARDFKAQIDAVSEAEESFARPSVLPTPTSSPFGVAAAPPAPPPQQTREGKGAVKRNVERADAFGF